MPQEPGHLAGDKIISLGGLIDSHGRGRILVDKTIASLTAGVIVNVMPANIGRVWAIIQNTGVSVVAVYFAGAGNHICLLQPNGVLQIDHDLAWTGEVYVASVTVNGGPLQAYEAIVEP